MKKIATLLLVCLLYGGLSCNSQTLHAIIFANTKSPGNPNNPNDPGIGPSVTVDFERMGIEMTTIASFIGYKLKKYYYYDTSDRFSRSSLVNVLNSLSCGKDDIVFFYYSGHGGRYENEESDFPEMILKVPYGPAAPQYLYPLYDVYKNIRKKSPRLTIVFGDLCNSTWKGAYRNISTAKGATMKSTSVCDIYKNLFLNVKGGLIAASSKPGHTSGCALFDDGSQAGGNFTASFLQCLGICVSQGKEISWNDLLENTRKTTQIVSKPDDQGEKQYPIFDLSDLKKAEPPVIPSSSQQAPSVSIDTPTTALDNLGEALTTIANDRNKYSDRIKAISPTMSQYFSNPQVRIQVVGRDSKTIVNTTTVSSYLNYLSIATKMEQVMVLEDKKDANGKIVYLKVHEMHKE